MDNFVSQEAYELWFTPIARELSDDIQFVWDDEGNWTGEWETELDREHMALLEAMENVVEDTSVVDTTRPTLATPDDKSVQTFGTVFGRDVEPAADTAAAPPVGSDPPVESGATTPVGGSNPD